MSSKMLSLQCQRLYDQRDVVVHHRKLPSYPGPTDLEKLGLIPQGM
jgi:hypothetical protein